MQIREKSALTNHVHTTGHNMDFEKARILFNETNTIKREILESILINLSDHLENNTGIDLILFRLKFASRVSKFIEIFL